MHYQYFPGKVLYSFNNYPKQTHFYLIKAVEAWHAAVHGVTKSQT